MPVIQVTPPRPLAPARRAFAELLAEARARTLWLVSPLSNQDIIREPHPQVDPILTDLERILRFEERWLLDAKGDWKVSSYDEWFDLMMEVRQRVLERLDEAELDADQSAARARYRMVLEHEYQRGESILENLQSAAGLYLAAQRRPLPRGRRLADPGFMARFRGGEIEIGDPQSVWPEEPPPHRVELDPFWIDVTPVTNGDFLTFMAAGGYEAQDLWSDEGWDWVRVTQTTMPGNWLWRDGAWWIRWMGREEPIDLACPVGQISCHEAEAFARFVGKRLPNEVEWEAAASWDPEAQARRAYPWGNMPPSPYVANLDQLAFQTAAVGAFPGNISPIGCYGMIGDLWEWTSSGFVPSTEKPGDSLSTLPAGEFGKQHRVIRGGSWATRPGAIRISVRRPVRPDARHAFTGFRCARNA